MNPRKTRVIIALTMLLLAALPALAQSGSQRYYPERDGAFRFRLGAFQPEGDSEYWTEKEEDFTGSADDFENISLGADYLFPLNSRLSLMFSGSLFEGDTTNAYRDFEDNFGNRIRHDTTLGIASGTIGLLVHLAPPDFAIQPYIGAGGGSYFWEARGVRRLYRLRRLRPGNLLGRPEVRRCRLRLLRAGGAGSAHNAPLLHLRRGPLDRGRGRALRRLRRLRRPRPRRSRGRRRPLLEPVTSPVHLSGPADSAGPRYRSAGACPLQAVKKAGEARGPSALA